MEDKKEKIKKKILKRGVVYLSRIPPFMQPSHLRRIFSEFGEINRIYLTPEDQAISRKRLKFNKDRRKRFVDGWVEFSDKKVAKSVAESLNNTLIGGDRKSKFCNDIWNIKYLKDFDWNSMIDSLANERALKEQQLKLELSQAVKEREFFLKNVNTSHAINEIKKKRKRKQSESETNLEESEKKIKKFNQKTPIQTKYNEEEKFDILSELFS